MDNVVTAGTLGVGLLAVGTSLVLARTLVSRRSRPGALSLLAVAVTIAIGSVLHVLVADPIAIGSAVGALAWTTGDWWVVQGATVTVVAGCVWTPFALAYTGRDGLPATGLVTVGTVVSIVAVAVAATAAAEGVAPGRVEALSVLLLATAILVAVGVGMLLLASFRQNAFPIAEPLLLSAGAVVLCSGVLVAQRLESPWLLPVANALACGTLLVPVRRYPMFETLPAARVAGRERVFAALSRGVVVVDREGRIRDANERAAALFDVDPDAILERRFDDLTDAAPDPAALAGAPTPARVATADGRTLELTGRPIEGRFDRPVGYVVTCSDVTTRRLREERFALLRRFVAEVVGDRMEAVATTASGAVGEDEPSRSAAAERVWTEATALTRLVASARDVERAIDRIDDADDAGPERSAPDRTVAAVADAAAEGTDVDVAVEAPAERVASGVPRPVLRAIVGTVLEDVCRQATSVRVAVSDADGPEIDVAWQTAEGAAVDDRSGSLDALPVARLAIEQAGGTLSRGKTADGRDRISVDLPGPGATTALLTTRDPTGDDRSDAGSHDVGADRMAGGEP
jgi:PAS domain-containing protein